MNPEIRKYNPWTPLTEYPVITDSSVTDTTKAVAELPSSPEILSIGEAPLLTPLILDIDYMPFDAVRPRITRLGGSASAFENAKKEGLEKGLLIESAAGRLLHLILTKKAFEFLQKDFPYNQKFVEHSFYVLWTQHYLKRNPRYKKVVCEYPLGKSGARSDNLAFTHDGHREAFELTLSTTNVLANAIKYADTDISNVTFICRHYKLKEAVKACCREGGLPDNLFQRLGYQQLSSLTRYQNKNL